MLDKEGSISFVPELVELVESFIADYEAAEGPLEDDLERGLVLSFALGTVRDELDLVWDALATMPAFGTLHPKAVYAERREAAQALSPERRTQVKAYLRARGWLAATCEE